MNEVEFSLIGLIIFLLIMATTLFTLKKFKDIESMGRAEKAMKEQLEADKDLEDFEAHLLVEELTKDDFEALDLVEIKDQSVVMTITDLMTNFWADSLVKGKIEGQADFYKIVLPTSLNQAGGQASTTPVQGIYKGLDGKSNQAIFQKVDTKALKPSLISLSSLMSLSSLIVGQYYMDEINKRLNSINEAVSRINDFQEREFKSRIMTLLLRIGKINHFSSEIISNESLRQNKIVNLEALEGEGAQLLQQVNLTISDLIKKGLAESFKTYEKKTQELALMLDYQEILLAILGEISKLTQLLGNGQISDEISFDLYEKYKEQSAKLVTSLSDWQKTQLDLLEIDLNQAKRKKQDLIGMTQGAIKDKWRYKEVSKQTVEQIRRQLNYELLSIDQPKEFDDEDLEIIVDNGHYYYLDRLDDSSNS
ncbi:hypothetical protein OZX68_03480 [Streptococcaceae bacterium ESL0729]|nr:hypothetical protein OZX68_03480 [Streptococcaceae bacterium ESL0729]